MLLKENLLESQHKDTYTNQPALFL